MIVLAIDTATADLVAGVVEAGEAGETKALARALAESVTRTRAHNERLVPTVNGLLEQAGASFADIESIVVGCGPGPFTGLRVGMATAQAFGQALGVPVHGVVTHDAVARCACGESGAECLVVTDARRREVYWARYSGGRRVSGPHVTAPSQVDTIGVEMLSVPEELAGLLPAHDAKVIYCAPRPAGLVAAADLAARPGPLVAHYLRRPDAVPPARGPKSRAIPDVDTQALGDA
ncbi:tRNA (adenosine(37)-N6)-threonylcarbamoyltransferase complex dimerization subunit type 1 TsaB [Corynebacterium liangguodongii]|uniref:tRNA (Adenosine(37)-N6)-threonylcarbamoyltransferase complex dimerization subunit type 1 TsaB n=1 Tax=Corynebacterium liangguodongii TaxID=2079535 RepID=A0A2S0WCB8_9CORY|nr:tRNA (adenosine(37)-N6)-threonylcarbamoyltransferase complex dimerization subunit type 1 TsaB [Corynebacterium liangguodongii]AWB83421.1 tRNA (adenosine(37)-N6)-threonylcarbamoyltransferase complex dimerization subunit type 1 TsaB [Corynebacterium liangguodongii]PWC00489.1 tRNA (adenosine(37)-N6)-threonylcarbamoyltransferase complex dimerization subunit type 1 TsaB [Corynebacterium liangguodongii]